MLAHKRHSTSKTPRRQLHALVRPRGSCAKEGHPRRRPEPTASVSKTPTPSDHMLQPPGEVEGIEIRLCNPTGRQSFVHRWRYFLIGSVNYELGTLDNGSSVAHAQPALNLCTAAEALLARTVGGIVWKPERMKASMHAFVKNRGRHLR